MSNSKHVIGAGFVARRAVVTAHAHTKGVGHNNGFAPKDGVISGRGSAVNESFNNGTTINTKFTHKPGQIVASTKTN